MAGEIVDPDLKELMVHSVTIAPNNATDDGTSRLDSLGVATTSIALIQEMTNAQRDLLWRTKAVVANYAIYLPVQTIPEDARLAIVNPSSLAGKRAQIRSIEEPLLVPDGTTDLEGRYMLVAVQIEAA